MQGVAQSRLQDRARELEPGDESGLRRLGVNLTCDPNFSSKFLHAV
jgi:hypothetical protein